MTLIYEVITTPDGGQIVKADCGNGHLFFIPMDEANSDYQRYLRWLENPDADESGTL